jgi:hypothetical protein
MFYTRRSIIRDAALLSVAGATGAFPFSAFGQACPAPPTGSRPKDFASGIRIFFSGAWIFIQDPAKPTTNILAVTQDLPGATSSHSFPFGIWQPDFDANPSLPPIHNNGPYQITVDTVTSPSPDIDTLFRATLCNDPFTYLVNNRNDLQINTNYPTVRAISIPLPTQIIPAAFLVGASLSGDGRGRLKGGPSSPRVSGLATTHIFDYQGANNLTLKNGQGDTLDTVSADMNYHFHTVPLIPADQCHAAMMFANLLKLLASNSSTFTPDDLVYPKEPLGCLNMDIGPGTPLSVSPEEAEMQDCLSGSSAKTNLKAGKHAQHRAGTAPAQPGKQGNFTVKLASCAGGALGVGGGG